MWPIPRDRIHFIFKSASCFSFQFIFFLLLFLSLVIQNGHMCTLYEIYERLLVWITPLGCIFLSFPRCRFYPQVWMCFVFFSFSFYLFYVCSIVFGILFGFILLNECASCQHIKYNRHQSYTIYIHTHETQRIWMPCHME